jgi:hypothetical protein
MRPTTALAAEVWETTFPYQIGQGAENHVLNRGNMGFENLAVGLIGRLSNLEVPGWRVE